MAYNNPVPVLFDSPVSKKVCLSFRFEDYVNAEQAAEAISRFIAEEYNGNIPPEWVQLENASHIVPMYEDIYLPPNHNKEKKG